MNIFQKNNLMSSSYRKRTCAIIKLFKEQKSNGQAPVAGLKGSLTLMEWLFYFVEDWMCWFRMNFTVAMDAFQPRSQGAGGFAPQLSKFAPSWTWGSSEKGRQKILRR
jgi:hypothetical protein